MADTVKNVFNRTYFFEKHATAVTERMAFLSHNSLVVLDFNILDILFCLIEELDIIFYSSHMPHAI